MKKSKFTKGLFFFTSMILILIFSSPAWSGEWGMRNNIYGIKMGSDCYKIKFISGSRVQLFERECYTGNNSTLLSTAHVDLQSKKNLGRGDIEYVFYVSAWDAEIRIIDETQNPSRIYCMYITFNSGYQYEDCF